MKIETITEDQVKSGQGCIAVRNGGRVELLISFDKEEVDVPYSVCLSFTYKPPIMDFFPSLAEVKAFAVEQGWEQDEFKSL